MASMTEVSVHIFIVESLLYECLKLESGCFIMKVYILIYVYVQVSYIVDLWLFTEFVKC